MECSFIESKNVEINFGIPGVHHVKASLNDVIEPYSRKIIQLTIHERFNVKSAHPRIIF